MKATKIRTLLAAGAVALSLSACTSVIDIRGNAPNPDMIAMIQPGQMSRADVAALLGTPSNTGAFDGDNWYYISSTFEQVAFFAPDEIDRKVVVVRFDPKGLVRDITEFGLENGQIVQVSDRTTPTAGHDLGILEQLFGNMGRFAK